MTSQVTDSGKHKRETAVCSMESTKDDSPMKSRFIVVRKEIYSRYKEKQQTEQPVRHSNESCQSASGKVKLSR